MKHILFIVCCFYLVFPGFLYAELYKYYDQNGTLCYTNDFSLVPDDQKSKTETIREIKTKAVEPVSPDEDNTEAQSSVMVNTNDGTDFTLELDQELKKLEEIKKDLEYEYAILNERRNILTIEGEEEMDSIERSSYNEKANALNRDTIRYKEKKKAYLRRAEEYNKKLRSVQ